MDTISRQTARRFVLGRQGLWPGRRWSGKEGVDAAIRKAECIQIDTINTVARSHDLALLSRVADYDSHDLDCLLYDEREFFDYGAILMIYPAAERTYVRAIMERRRADWENRDGPLGDIHQFVLEELRTRGPLANRGFANRIRIPGGFGTVKDTDLALYRLWSSGEVATHGRRGFERVYGLSAQVHGDEGAVGTIEEAEAHFCLKAVRDCGLATPVELARRMTVMVARRVSPREAAARLNGLVAVGRAVQLRVEGVREPLFAPGEDVGDLCIVDNGGTPESWAPIGVSTTEEAGLIAPLDNTLWDRARALSLFEFEYVWEVYKPADQRKWGYYTMPILWGDRFAGRIWPQLNRKEKVLSIEGIWVEDGAYWKDGGFVEALAAGLSRLMGFVGAEIIDPRAVPTASLRKRIQRLVSPGGRRRA